MNLRFHFATMMAALAVGWGASARADVIQVTDFTPIASASPGEWGIETIKFGGTASIDDLTGKGGNLENSQPSPIGAAFLTTPGANDKAEVGIYNHYGSFAGLLSTLQLGYEFYKDTSGSNGSSDQPAPSMKIGLWDGTSSVLGYLVYEPRLSPVFHFPPKDVWTSETMDKDTGLWWWTGKFGTPGNFNGPYQTLSAWGAAFALSPNPNLTMEYVGMGMGSGNPDSKGYFDNVHILAGTSDHTYDFGPQAAPEPTSLALLALGGFGLIAGRRRKTKV